MTGLTDVVAAVGVGVIVVRHRRDVGAGREGLLAAGQHDAADAVVGVELGQRVAQLVHHVVVERIERLGTVQANHGNTAVGFDQQIGILHGTPLFMNDTESAIVSPAPQGEQSVCIRNRFTIYISTYIVNP
jgi:hypothetical protein